MNKNIEEIIGTEFNEQDMQFNTEMRNKAHPNFNKLVKESNHPSGVWSIMAGGKVFFPAEETVKSLPPGIYTAGQTMSGQVFFVKQDILSDDLIDLPDDNSTKVLKHIEEFRGLKDSFTELGYLYKRGILLFGPQGGGKTATVIKTIRTFVDEGGIALLGDYPTVDSKALQVLRDFELERPVVVVYEDIDDTVRYYGDRTLTALLDGENNIENVLYLATTNYPERLPPRLLNRPSRFDVVQFIGLPNEDARKAYLMAKTDLSLGELSNWVEKTAGLSIPHLKELIILVKIYNKTLEESVTRLKAMGKLPSSSSYYSQRSATNLELNFDMPVEVSMPQPDPVVVNIPETPQPVINVMVPGQKGIKKSVTRDSRGLIVSTTETPLEDEQESD